MRNEYENENVDWEQLGIRDEAGAVETTAALVPLKTAEVKVNQMPQLIAPDQFPDLDEMEESFALAAKYLEFEKAGESARGVFLGFTKMQNQKGEPIALANFQNRDGVWVNAGANLTYQLRDRGVPTGTPLKVTYQGKIKTKSGNEVKSFEVRLLTRKDSNSTNAFGQVPQMNLKAGGVDIPSKQPAMDAFQDLENLVARHAAGIKSDIPEAATKRYRQEAAISLSKTALGNDNALRHAFLNELWGREGLSECNAQELMALRDWAIRDHAKTYIAEWKNKHKAQLESENQELFAEPA